MKRRLALLFALIAFVVSVILWLPRPAPPIEAILPARELRIGIDPSNPPFAFSQADVLTGLDIDLAEALAAEIGVPSRYVLLGFDGLYDALKVGQVDIVIAALTVDPARFGLARYSQPYFNAGMLLISAAARPIERMADVSGRRLALEFGSEADAEARRWLRRVQPFTLQPYEQPSHALDAARIGEADAALTDALTARLYLREHPDWQTNAAYVTVLPLAIASHADRGDLAVAIDRAMTALFADGTIDAIIIKWL
ncbi:MAG: transporter substrate-binding domain-containing protein [Chloroflexota bacterium]|nr:transporter substrate-binding domain-containing protein [Chloroflexota bacterium]